MTDQLLARGSLVLVIGFLVAGFLMFGVAVHACVKRALIRNRERRAQAERNAKRLADMIRAEREQVSNLRYMSPEQLRHILKLDEKPKRPETFREWSAIPKGPFAPMTPEERNEQRISFAYGQQPHDGPQLSKDEVRAIAENMGLPSGERVPYTKHAPICRDNCPGYDSDDCTEQCHDFWQCEGKGRAG